MLDRPEDDSGKRILRMRVRFDYKGRLKNNRTFFKSKGVEQVVEQVREHQAALLRNVPVQGIKIEDIDMSCDVYTVYDEFGGSIMGYAPVVITFRADSLEDAVHFIMKEEFRKIEVLEPDNISLSKIDIERLLFKVNEELKSFKAYMEKKMEFWK
ncbi:MAG: hypothetical protein ACM3UZ_00075 [Acidobacteriota bacterium]